VAETLNLSQLEGYTTGGTIHIIINNQIGFTTLPKDSRSTPYSTDVARMLMAPIFHCHGEEPEAAIQAARLAVAYRQQFHRDVVIEMTCYRRHGHNEGDEPFFTQPLMYDKIKARPSVHTIYADRLRELGVAEETITGMATACTERLNGAMGKRAEPVAVGFRDLWSGMQREYAPITVATGVERERLVRLSEKLATLPDGFSPHPKIGQLYQRRLDAIKAGQGLDWGNAETLAYATLLCDGVPVRLSGQDSRRGTFNHRHATLHDLKTGTSFVPLTTVCREGASFQVFDSMLSEAAVLGFEYGYSLENPRSLTLWEAQFGDFANGAQVVIDQFIAAGESKWDRSSGLVMLLPHGYEGQGAEHSSARMERYLQLCALNNLFVTYPSTPAQMFHLLRRQVNLPFRKPLVVFTPKSLLRHPACVSSLDDLVNGTFREVIPAPATEKTVKSLLICTGKIYYDLLERQQRDGRDDVTIVRIEQLYPLRVDLLREALGIGMPGTRFIWVQEEPKNMGAWHYIRPYLNRTIGREVGYCGRAEEAAPAVGSHRLHKQEQERIVEEAFA
jgi:2-oxoglutarate dehydrogenase E1 component